MDTRTLKPGSFFQTFGRQYKTLEWSEHLRGKMCAQTNTGSVDIVSMVPERKENPEPLPSYDTTRPPQWMIKGSCHAFGFGGRIAEFTQVIGL